MYSTDILNKDLCTDPKGGFMTTKEIAKSIKEGALDGRFCDIYVDALAAKAQNDRYLNVLSKYEKAFGEERACIYSAPGRTEIGGNHTDHQHGHVLAAAINKDAVAVAAPSDDDRAYVISDGGSMIEVDITHTEPRADEKGTTKALIRGVLYALKERGYEIGGFKAYITSDVLIGAGLSSSAAFENLIATIISHMYNGGTVPAETVAMVGQYAENVHFGKPCGLMDQMASSVGGLVYIDFKDTNAPVIDKTEYDFAAEGWSLCITDTKGSHADLTPEYAAVPAEMGRVAGFFGRRYLSEVDEDDFMRVIPEVREKCGDRAVLRAMHFFEETKRADRERDALKAGDAETFFKLVRASGDSSFKYLQNVYAPKDPIHQAVSVALAVSERVLGEKGACRVHGGGFAGTIQAWVPTDLADEYTKTMDEVFGEGACVGLSIRNYGGIKVV